MAVTSVRPFVPEFDHGWAAAMLAADFGGTRQARRGEVLDTLDLPGLVAEEDGMPVGLLSYRIEGKRCELFFIAAHQQWRGVGTAMVEALVARAREAACTKIWLVTTNDNLGALRFYQRRGFDLVALYPGAVAESRRLKPGIPQVGADGIARRDELELERRLVP